MSIYLDYNAGAPVRTEVREAMVELLGAGAGNPASVHRAGQRGRKLLERARLQVAELVGARPEQIVFTSGGTEANNLALVGATRAAGAARRAIVSSEIEHSSVLGPLARLAADGLEVIQAKPDRHGRLDAGALAAAVTHATALVTLGYANSEVGTIQSLTPVAAAARRVGAVFHVDAVQALGRVALDAAALGCDLMTLSGHKFGAPAGIGALFVREPGLIAALMAGGPQEGGLRPGTPNLMGAVAMGVAAEVVTRQGAQEMARCGELTARLRARLYAAIPGLEANSPADQVLPNTLNLMFPGVLGETMLIALDLQGVQVSMGSACAAGAVEPSHVLLAMGRSSEQARSSLRISLGYGTSEDEIERVGAMIPTVWQRVVERAPARSLEARA